MYSTGSTRQTKQTKISIASSEKNFELELNKENNNFRGENDNNSVEKEVFEEEIGVVGESLDRKILGEIDHNLSICNNNTYL